MTVLGKILAVLNLVLSLAVGALIIVTFVARTNWHAAYENMKKQADVSKADATAFREEMEKARGEKAKADEQLVKLKLSTDKEKQTLNAQVNDLGEKLKQAGVENSKHVAAHSAAAEELKRRTKEVEYLKSLVGLRDTQLSKWQKQVNDMRDAMVEARINYNAEHERNERLLQENERVTKDNQRIRQVGTSTSLRAEAPKRNPPAEDITGRVTSTDPANGLITVSVGSDAGLSKGNTLEVYRLKPTASYLGTIRILDVRPNAAVGRPIDRVNGTIQVGDEVSSNILRRGA
jgi:hypothetical protein